MKCLLIPALCAICLHAQAAPVPDTPFNQHRALHYRTADALDGASFRKVRIDRNGVAYVLSDRALARTFDGTLSVDRTFRPLAQRVPLDVAMAAGHLHYLFPDEWLSNGDGGRSSGTFPDSTTSDGANPNAAGAALAISSQGDVLAHAANGWWLFPEGDPTPRRIPAPSSDPAVLLTAGHRFLAAAGTNLLRLVGGAWESFPQPLPITALHAGPDRILVGTTAGFYGLDARTLEMVLPIQTRVPVPEVTSLAESASGIWVGTPRGAFVVRPDQSINYFASQRWLLDDDVIDLAAHPGGDVCVLTRRGLSRILVEPLTLANKAEWYERKIRDRHIRSGFCAETRLTTPGDVTTAELIDSDNDGLWSAIYMASQAFRHAVTGSTEARANAWETFTALERLEAITPINGFPARSFERAGFKVADPRHWHATEDRRWEWKGTTSSDEIVGHLFGYAVLHETAAVTATEKDRIVTLVDRIVGHIVNHDLNLVDVDGRPTLWGKWHPDYVNSFPRSVGDRRLNSAEIIGFLQLAWHLTGKALYREQAMTLLHEQGYLDNIRIPIRELQFTEGHMDLASTWNHSDDQLAFLSYWLLDRYALNEDLRRQFQLSIRDHWDIERIERNPLWNFIHAAAGAEEFGLEEALWTLRNYPLDLITWRVENSHRGDLTLLPPNFRRQQSAELLPPGERRVMRWNGNPFELDGGDGGHHEQPGDEWLLPYWMGRHLGLIDAPATGPGPYP